MRDVHEAVGVDRDLGVSAIVGTRIGLLVWEPAPGRIRDVTQVIRVGVLVGDVHFVFRVHRDRRVDPGVTRRVDRLREPGANRPGRVPEIVLPGVVIKNIVG